MRQTVEQLLGRYLSIRARSEQEVRRYLAGKSKKYDISSEQIDGLVEKYTRLGFINDTAFAESVTHSVVINKAKGKRYLAGKLYQAGVDKTLITQTLQNLDPEEVTQAMQKRIDKNEKKLAKFEGRERYAKAYSYLAGAGFSSSEIRPFLDEWVKAR